jgi:hypothetical protein
MPFEQLDPQEIELTDQRSEKWYELHDKLPISASEVAIAIGLHNKESLYGLYQQKAAKYRGEEVTKKNTITPFAEFAINHGINTENEAVQLVADILNVTVHPGRTKLYPKDPRIGGTTDGYISNKIGLEIKCPVSDDDTQTLINRPHDHVQMQTCMAINGLDYMIYCIYFTHPKTPAMTKKYHIAKVPFNKEAWENEIYPAICTFLDQVAGIAEPPPKRQSGKAAFIKEYTEKYIKPIYEDDVQYTFCV